MGVFLQTLDKLKDPGRQHPLILNKAETRRRHRHRPGHQALPPGLRGRPPLRQGGQPVDQPGHAGDGRPTRPPRSAASSCRRPPRATSPTPNGPRPTRASRRRSRTRAVPPLFGRRLHLAAGNCLMKLTERLGAVERGSGAAAPRAKTARPPAGAGAGARHRRPQRGASGQRRRHRPRDGPSRPAPGGPTPAGKPRRSRCASSSWTRSPPRWTGSERPAASSTARSRPPSTASSSGRTSRSRPLERRKFVPGGACPTRSATARSTRCWPTRPSPRSCATPTTRSGWSATGRLEHTDLAFTDDAQYRAGHRQDRVGRRPPRRRVAPDGRRPPPRRLPGQRHHPAAGAQRRRAHDPEVRRRPLHGEGPHQLRHLHARPRHCVMEACVRGKLNILVSGGTGTGKTTNLNVLSSFIPDGERIITIEDSAELQLQQPHVVNLEARPPNAEGTGEVRIRDLVKNALRMRPDRIIVGEVRGGEALDMLQAMNTGHEGSMTTVHANTPRDALARLETMVLMAGFDLPVRAIREQIASALDLIVQVDRMPDGRRVHHRGRPRCRASRATSSSSRTLQVPCPGCRPAAARSASSCATGLRPKFLDKLIAARRRGPGQSCLPGPGPVPGGAPRTRSVPSVAELHRPQRRSWPTGGAPVIALRSPRRRRRRGHGPRRRRPASAGQASATRTLADILDLPFGRAGRRPRGRHRAARRARREHESAWPAEGLEQFDAKGTAGRRARAGPAPAAARRVRPRRRRRRCRASALADVRRHRRSLLFGVALGARRPRSWPGPSSSCRVARRRKAFEAQLPDALTLIASSLSAGHTFLRAIQMMCEEAERAAGARSSPGSCPRPAGRPAGRRPRAHGRAARHPRPRVGGAGHPHPADRRRQAGRPAPHAGRLHPGPGGDPPGGRGAHRRGPDLGLGARRPARRPVLRHAGRSSPATSSPMLQGWGLGPDRRARVSSPSASASSCAWSRSRSDGSDRCSPFGAAAVAVGGVLAATAMRRLRSTPSRCGRARRRTCAASTRGRAEPDELAGPCSPSRSCPAWSGR